MNSYMQLPEIPQVVHMTEYPVNMSDIASDITSKIAKYKEYDSKRPILASQTSMDYTESDIENLAKFFNTDMRDRIQNLIYIAEKASEAGIDISSFRMLHSDRIMERSDLLRRSIEAFGSYERLRSKIPATLADVYSGFGHLRFDLNGDNKALCVLIQYNNQPMLLDIYNSADLRTEARLLNQERSLCFSGSILWDNIDMHNKDLLEVYNGMYKEFARRYQFPAFIQMLMIVKDEFDTFESSFYDYIKCITSSFESEIA